MRNPLIKICSMAVMMASLLPAATACGADEILAPHPLDEVRSRALEWVAARKVSEEQIVERIGAVWAGLSTDTPARQVFDRVIETFRLADVDTRRFLDLCDLMRPKVMPPDLRPLLDKHSKDEFYSANMRLFFVRHLAQRAMYEEALEVFKDLDPARVVDPASCLFFRAVCEHQLLRKADGLATIDKLLTSTQRVPESYAGLAKLMQHDLRELEEDSLGVVSRKMKDSERRLDLGRGGQKVQKVQDEIVAQLDELIKKAQQQQSGGGGEGSGENNTNQSDGPASDSQIKGATAPGEIDPKDFKKQGGWGTLPPKAEARAKNLINQEFPSHYKQAVEQYFKKLANRRAPNERQP